MKTFWIFNEFGTSSFDVFLEKYIGIWTIKSPDVLVFHERTTYNLCQKYHKKPIVVLFGSKMQLQCLMKHRILNVSKFKIQFFFMQILFCQFSFVTLKLNCYPLEINWRFSLNNIYFSDKKTTRTIYVYIFFIN